MHLYVGSGTDLVHRVRGHELDCAISSSPLVDPKLAALPPREERYTLVAAKAQLRAHALRNEKEARHHTLFDTAEDLPLFRAYGARCWRASPRSSQAAPSPGSHLSRSCIASESSLHDGTQRAPLA